MKSVLFIYPHQLYTAEYLPVVDHVYVIEEPLLFGTDEQYPFRFHKQKLVLHRAAMRRYVEEVLWPANFTADYFDILDTNWSGQPILKAVEQGYEKIFTFDLCDQRLERRLKDIIVEQKLSVQFEVLKSPNFYLHTSDISQFFRSKKTYHFEEFYQWQRERFNILISEDYRPEGGKWSFEAKDTRVPETTKLPGIQSFGDNHYVQEAIQFVEEHFPNNPGNASNFIWPTSHAEAAKWLDDFLDNRFFQYGEYENSSKKEAVWLFHSLLSSSLNCGLINPEQVVEASLQAVHKNSVPLLSAENFVRQVIGWREFVRAIYIRDGMSLRNSNVFRNERKLSKNWYDGTTNLQPLDNTIKKVLNHAYATNTERLSVVGNLMLLSEVDPNDVYCWFMELFIDAYDWVVVPNVYGISQFADGGTMVSKPALFASSYIISVSDFERGEWCNVWDGLYWRFIDKHRRYFGRNPRVGGVLVRRYDSMDASRRRIIGYRAQDFIANYTLDKV